MSDTAPKAPSGLSKRSRDLWVAVLADYDLGAAELEVLRGALESLDRADEAGEVLKRDGLSTVDRYGSPKAHPLLDVEQRCRTAFRQSVRQLGLEVEDDTSRTPHPSSVRAQHAARVRWSR